MANQLVIDKVRQIYLEQRGRDHRRLELRMRLEGHSAFNRRVLYAATRKNGTVREGWIRRFKWDDELRRISEDTGVVSTRPGGQPRGKSQNAPGFRAWLKKHSSGMTWSWRYQQIIFQKLRDVTDGTCKRLMIFVPPRHGKSELVTVRYAAWRLSRAPSTNIILGSYSQRLANRFSRKVRIVWEDSLQRQEIDGETESEDAGAKCGHEAGSAPLSSGERTAEPASESSRPSCLDVSAVQTSSRRRLNTVSEWETGLGGGVRAVGVGGGITGFGADLVIIDDPVKSRAEAESKTYRDRLYDWFNDDLYTRLEPGAAIVLIQTRWHEDDLAGRLLRESADGGESWDVVSLPALAEDHTAETPRHREEQKEIMADDPKCGSEDQRPQPSTEPPILSPRLNVSAVCADGPALSRHPSVSCDPLGRAPGEALCPERFSRDDLLRIRRRLGSYSFSALYQQRPSPPEGGLFRRSWFRTIVDRPPDGLRWVRSYDLAVSTATSADFTASVRCAFDPKTGALYIADGFPKRIEFPDQRRFIVERIRAEPATEHGIELALHGQAFIQELRREHRLFGRAFRGVKVTADKFTRALSWANIAEEGKVILVRGSSTPGVTGSVWIEEFLDEVCAFPNAAHDDQVDAVSLAVQMLELRKHVSYGF